jgi:protein-disulfide isomerase
MVIRSIEHRRTFPMRRLFVLAGAVAGVLTLGALPALAQPSEELKDLRKDVDALKESQKAIQNDLQELKSLLTRARPPAPPQEAVLSIDGAPVKGQEDAKVTLLEFTDYQ